MQKTKMYQSEKSAKPNRLFQQIWKIHPVWYGKFSTEIVTEIIISNYILIIYNIKYININIKSPEKQLFTIPCGLIFFWKLWWMNLKRYVYWTDIVSTWTAWSAWSSCSSTCGSGSQSRESGEPQRLKFERYFTKWNGVSWNAVSQIMYKKSTKTDCFWKNMKSKTVLYS